MGQTTRGGLRYPELLDPPNVPGFIRALAEDTEGQLFRALATDDTGKTALASALTPAARGFLIDNGTTGNIERWNGTAFVPVGGGGGTSGGGGGGGTAYAPIKGQWKASTNQSIPSGADTPIAFGTEEIASAVVTRSAFGAGHKFTLGEDGTYAISATVRFGSGSDGGNRFVELRNASNSGRWAAQGNDGGPGAVTLSLAVTDRFAAGTELYVSGSQQSGSTLTLQRASTSPALEGFVTIRILKIAG